MSWPRPNWWRSCVRRAGLGEVGYWTDGWDGYPAARQRFLDAMAASRVPNPVLIGGDIHSFWATDLKADFNNPWSATLATEFVGTSITSDPPPHGLIAELLPENPHVRYFESRHRGYVAVDLNRDRMQARFRIISDRRDPKATVSTLKQFVVERGGRGHREQRLSVFWGPWTRSVDAPLPRSTDLRLTGHYRVGQEMQPWPAPAVQMLQSLAIQDTTFLLQHESNTPLHHATASAGPVLLAHVCALVPVLDAVTQILGAEFLDFGFGHGAIRLWRCRGRVPWRFPVVVSDWPWATLHAAMSEMAPTSARVRMWGKT